MSSTSEGKYMLIKNEDPDVEGTEFDVFSVSSRHKSFLHRFKRLHYLPYCILIFSNVVLATLWLRSLHNGISLANDCVRPQLIYSPATSALRYEKRRLWRDIDSPNPFTGTPRPEFDQAWRNIIQPMTIKVSASELARFSEGDTTVAFKDGSGYLAEMAVYHELHCVKRIRHFIHKEHYYPNMTEADRVRENTHMDHCLEYFREAAICRGDVTLTTFFWKDGVPTSRVYDDHECVNWDSLDSWARERMVNMNDLSSFV